MDVLKKQKINPIDRIIIFAKEKESSFADIIPVDRIEGGRIISLNDEYVLPISDATIYNTNNGILYVFNGSFRYLEEVTHLGEVERNMIVSQAFLYPGRNPSDKQQPNLMNIVIIGVLTLIAIIGMFT